MIAQIPVDNKVSHQHFEPKFADARIRAVWKRAVASYDRGYPLDFVVTGSRGTFRVLLDKERMRQDGDAGSLAFSGKKVQIKTAKGISVLEKRKVDLPKVASKAGLELDPGVRTWAFDLNPMEHLVNPGATARLNGNLVSDGTKCDLVELVSPGLKMNLILRHADGLPLKIWSEVRDPNGVLVSSSERKFSYVSIRKPIPSKRFSLR